MSEKLLLIDIDKCVRCYACEVACKQENDFPLGVRACRVITVGPREMQGERYMDFVTALCLHCDEPFCSHFCPLDAIVKREDGIVLVDDQKCNGCQRCIHGCPYGAMYFNPEKKVAAKCSLCVARIDDGLEPSCVQHCIGGSLQFVTQQELDKITQGQHRVRIGKVYYTSSRWQINDLGK